MTRYGRRQFIGGLAGSALATGVAGPAVAQETPVVEMGNNYFDPVGLFVDPGTTVRFDLAADTHSATAYGDRIPSEAAAFDSGTISEGSFEHTFETPGTYDYYCIPHRSVGMVGRIVVGSPGGPAEDSPIPDGDVPTSETIVDRGSVPRDDSTDGDHCGMMDHGGGPGMLSGRTGGVPGVVPVLGWTLGALGVLGGALYLALRGEPADAGPDDTAMATLRRRYARGDVDEEEFRRRRDRLESGDTDDLD